MKHRVQKSRLSRKTHQRKALIRALLTSLFTHGKVQTTVARAKALVAATDSLGTSVRSQKEEREQIRIAKQVLYTEQAQKNLIHHVLGDAQHTSGLTRSTPLGPRKGDGSRMIQVEFSSSAPLS